MLPPEQNFKSNESYVRFLCRVRVASQEFNYNVLCEIFCEPIHNVGHARRAHTP
jgi:hypothetical protein